MSLPARQQRVLDAIEGVLEAGEPRIAAMFAIFTRLARSEGPISAERLSRPRTRPRPDILYLLFPVLATATLIATLVVGLATASAPACGTAALAMPAPRSAVSCAALRHPGGR